MQESSGIQWRELLPVIYGASWLVSIACEVVLLVIILTVVRRNRPDAYRPLMLWAIISLAMGVFGQSAAYFFARSASGIDAMMRGQAINGLVNIGVHLGLALLLMRGLIAIAQPRKEPPVEAVGPYR